MKDDAIHLVKIMLLCVLIVWVCWMIFIRPAYPHAIWADGTAVPKWVASACCGEADAHLLNDSQIHMLSDGVHIDGITTVVPYDKVLPSQDGRIWAFYSDARRPDPPVYCFFYSGSI